MRRHGVLLLGLAISMASPSPAPAESLKTAWLNKGTIGCDTIDAYAAYQNARLDGEYDAFTRKMMDGITQELHRTCRVFDEKEKVYILGVDKQMRITCIKSISTEKDREGLCYWVLNGDVTLN